MLSMPISIRYGVCKLAAIAKGKPQFDSIEGEEKEKRGNNYIF